MKIEADSFITYGQKIVDINGTTVCVEFLTRLKDNNVDIEKFFAFAPKAVIKHIFQKQLKEAIDFYQKTGIPASVNIDRDTFMSLNWQKVKKRIESKGTQIVLELTHVRGLIDPAYVEIISNSIVVDGARITLTLDDYNSNLKSYINDYNVPCIKLDKGMLNGLDSLNTLNIRKKQISKLKKKFRICVAEGVEKWEDIIKLHGMGVDYFQGYYFHRPTPLGELIATLNLP